MTIYRDAVLMPTFTGMHTLNVKKKTTLKHIRKFEGGAACKNAR